MLTQNKITEESIEVLVGNSKMKNEISLFAHKYG